MAAKYGNIQWLLNLGVTIYSMWYKKIMSVWFDSPPLLLLLKCMRHIFISCVYDSIPLPSASPDCSALAMLLRKI